MKRNRGKWCSNTADPHLKGVLIVRGLKLPIQVAYQLMSCTGDVLHLVYVYFQHSLFDEFLHLQLSSCSLMIIMINEVSEYFTCASTDQKIILQSETENIYRNSSMSILGLSDNLLPPAALECILFCKLQILRRHAAQNIFSF